MEWDKIKTRRENQSFPIYLSQDRGWKILF